MAGGATDVLLDKPSADDSHEGEHHGDYGASSVPISYSVRLYAICASVNRYVGLYFLIADLISTI